MRLSPEDQAFDKPKSFYHNKKEGIRTISGLKPCDFGLKINRQLLGFVGGYFFAIFRIAAKTTIKAIKSTNSIIMHHPLFAIGLEG